ncbi:hypothetical protein RFI_14123 [Reticulomyxa filosa]|uniref:PX domain-containing protein n=1 Tax=Reticulomyxa filosa TaxID=46433 RepID=X6NBB5_RETFI|nr:hypothetical protein RFI_14123 [Reticulomyxa filosa]|eukprot:ETO23059.1 hypothetical protein RFI_14123 [Reticulomyxa filosa]
MEKKIDDSINAEKHNLGLHICVEDQRTDSNSNITFYKLLIHVEGLKITYNIERRFRDFDALHKKLSSIFNSGVLPELPPKTLRKKFDDDFVNQRKEDLDRYCVLCYVDFFLFSSLPQTKLGEAPSERLHTKFREYLHGLTSRLFLINNNYVWDFFELSKYVNPYLYRYQCIHLNTFLCNDYKPIPPNEKPPPLPPPPSPRQSSLEDNALISQEQRVPQMRQSMTANSLSSQTTKANESTNENNGFLSSLFNSISGTSANSNEHKPLVCPNAIASHKQTSITAKEK